ncbi:MAG: NUDIX domain-containing protein [bacterium]|nr:NUDIX domain-containing protein [bacterium]
MEIRIVTRVVVYDSEGRKVLLVKNRGQDFWYPPGGGWDYNKENIIECAEREVLEETGLSVKIIRLLYVQEFHEGLDTISFEIIWLANPIATATLNKLHIDQDVDGKVEKAEWFSEKELQDIKVFPERLRDTFWKNIEKFLKDEDPFIGIKNS